MKARPCVYLASLFTMASLLTACGGVRGADTPTPVVDQRQETKVLSGTVEDWAGDDVVVRAEAYNDEGVPIILAKSPVAADGSFSLSLPGAEGLRGALVTLTEEDLACETDHGTATGAIEMMPSRVGLASVELTVYPSSLPDSNNVDYLGSFYLGNAERSVEVMQFYAAVDASLRGTCTFTERREDPEAGQKAEFTDTITLDLDLVAGWNNVILTTEENSGSYSTVASTGTIPEELSWQHDAMDACDLGDCEGGL